jgi:16S rRNA processing protein RimM
VTGTTRLVVGRVRGLHGLRGLVRVEVLTDRPEDRFVPGAVLFPEGSDRGLTVASAAPVEDGPGWRLAFREVRDRTSAEALRDVYLEIAVDRQEDLPEGQAYWHEVIGAEVRGRDGRVLGTVADVYRVAEAEVYEVRGGPPGTFDLPVVRSIVTDFRPAEGWIGVDETALDLDAEPVEPRVPRPRRAHRWSRHGKGGDAGRPVAADADPQPEEPPEGAP